MQFTAKAYSGSRRAILFDVDGVLVQTEPLRAQAHAAVVRLFGGSIAPSFYFAIHAVGKSHEQTRSAFIRASNIRVSEAAYTAAFRKLFMKSLHAMLPTPGIASLLSLLRKQGYLLGAVSSSDSREVKALLKQSSLARFFSFTVSGGEVRKKKPAPDLYRLALHRLPFSRERVVAVEDSETGIQSARAAHLPVIAYRHRYNREHDFSGARAVVSSFTDWKRFLSAVAALTADSR